MTIKDQHIYHIFHVKENGEKHEEGYDTLCLAIHQPGTKEILFTLIKNNFEDDGIEHTDWEMTEEDLLSLSEYVVNEFGNKDTHPEYYL